MHMSSVGNAHADVSEIPNRLVHPVPEVAVLLGGVTERYVWTLISTGALQSMTLGRRRVVAREDIDAFLLHLREQEQVARAAAAGDPNTGGSAGTGPGGGAGSGTGSGGAGSGPKAA
jgi:uncharacterized membrane protein YgcG